MRTIKTLFFIGFCFFSFQLWAQVGINTTTPLSTLDINGNLSVKTLGIPTTFNGGPGGSATPIIDGVYISLMPGSSGFDQFYIPQASTVPGRIYILRNISDSINALIYTPSGDFYAKDSSTLTPQPLIMPFNAVMKTVILVSDGINWTYIF
jgi:hypothetical protein